MQLSRNASFKYRAGSGVHPTEREMSQIQGAASCHTHIVLSWLATPVVVNGIAPQAEKVGKEHSVATTAKDAPSTIAMMRIGRNFRRFESDTTAMVLLEGQDKAGR